MRWIAYPLKCFLFGILAMQMYFAVQITVWAFVDPSTTAFQRAERWRLCTWHWSCPIESRWVAYESIAPSLKRAVLVSEDDIFFQHPGVRVSDMQKAWEKNQKHAKNKKAPILRGGSTITQQLGKNLFLSSEQHYVRKAQELVITGLLELILSKERLLEIYLNSVEWGEGIFGVGAAAKHYFATTPQLLSREQAASLASALPAPKCFDKVQYCRRGRIDYGARQEFILANMDRIALPRQAKQTK